MLDAFYWVGVHDAAPPDSCSLWLQDLRENYLLTASTFLPSCDTPILLFFPRPRPPPQCKVLVKGQTLQRLGRGAEYEALRPEHIWWLIHVGSGMVVAAYHDVEKGDLLREMTLPK